MQAELCSTQDSLVVFLSREHVQICLLVQTPEVALAIHNFMRLVIGYAG